MMRDVCEFENGKLDVCEFENGNIVALDQM
jgi:hypothetical protein